MNETNIEEITIQIAKLLKIDNTEISPSNCVIGTELLHHNLPIFSEENNSITNITKDNNSITNITEEKARIMGFFFGNAIIVCGKMGNFVAL